MVTYIFGLECTVKRTQGTKSIVWLSLTIPNATLYPSYSRQAAITKTQPVPYIDIGDQNPLTACDPSGWERAENRRVDKGRGVFMSRV